MLLKSIRVENFQQHQEVYELNGLLPGLNIVCGNNEAGKSTLLRVLRAVLFDRFNGKAGDDYAGYRGGSPEVTIQFEFQGNNYTLEKIFSKKKDGRAVLTDSSGNQWIATEAETYLANLLQFDSIDRGLAKPEQQGIYGVLWVEQGKAWEQVKLSDNASATQAIQDVLGHELTDMLSRGKGEALLNTFSTDLKQYQTEKTGKPSGEFKTKIEAMGDAQNRLNLLKTELKNYQDTIDELAHHKQELFLLTENNTEQEDKKKLDNAKKDLQGVEKLNEEYKEDKQNLELMQARYESSQAKNQERIKLIESLQREKSFLEENKSKVGKIEVELSQFQEDFQTSQTELSKAKISYDTACATLDKARASHELVKLQEHIKKINAQLEQADRLQVELAYSQEKFAQIRIDDSGLHDIKEANKHVDTLRIRLDSIATRLRFTIVDTTTDALLNDKPLSGKGEQLITEATELKFGMNKIAIIPGGEELETLQLQSQKANEKLAFLFNRYHVSSINEAEMQVNAKTILISETKSLKDQIKIIAPEGIEKLQEILSRNKGEEKSLQVKIGHENPYSVEEADNLVTKTRSEYEEKQKNERTFHGKHTAKKEETIQIKSQLARADNAVKLLDQQLELARESATDNQLKSQELTQKNSIDAAVIKLSKLKDSLQEVDIEGVRLEVDRRTIALQSTQQKLMEINQYIHDLELELVATGHRGLSEEKEQAEHHLIKETTDFERLSKHVGSLNLLCKIIKEEIQKTKELVVKPLTEAMRPYLKILFPDSEPIIDENFNLQNILRNGVLETFENLSMGTREQLAILIRLAYADLLAERGTPAMIVLDDALVNTDDDRREKMKQILYRASQKYQIILLTCHGNSYRDCGGAIYTLI